MGHKEEVQVGIFEVIVAVKPFRWRAKVRKLLPLSTMSQKQTLKCQRFHCQSDRMAVGGFWFVLNNSKRKRI